MVTSTRGDGRARGTATAGSTGHSARSRRFLPALAGVATTRRTGLGRGFAAARPAIGPPPGTRCWRRVADQAPIDADCAGGRQPDDVDQVGVPGDAGDDRHMSTQARLLGSQRRQRHPDRHTQRRDSTCANIRHRGRPSCHADGGLQRSQGDGPPAPPRRHGYTPINRAAASSPTPHTVTPADRGHGRTVTRLSNLRRRARVRSRIDAAVRLCWLAQPGALLALFRRLTHVRGRATSRAHHRARS
jgi:hypothetical protein